MDEMDIEIAYDNLLLRSVNAVPFGNRVQRVSLGVAKGSAYPHNDVSEFVLSQFGTIHLVSPLLPETITTSNYALCDATKRLLDEMYGSCGKEPPKLAMRSVEVPGSSYAIPRHLRGNNIIVPFSGGKDGAYHYLRARQRGFTPHLVHIQGMNQASCSEELIWAKKLSAFLGEPLDIVQLRNGVPKNGFDTMRFRDMLIVALMLPYNISFDAKQTVIEGFADELEGDMELFSGKEENMRNFNALLRELDFPVKIRWHNKPEWEVLEWLIRNRPDVLAQTNSCFAYPLLKVKMQRQYCWPKFPGFPFLESQCGGCFKCYIVNLSRIVFGDLACSRAVQRAYVSRAETWLAEKVKKLGTYYNDPSYTRLLELAKKKIKIK